MKWTLIILLSATCAFGQTGAVKTLSPMKLPPLAARSDSFVEKSLEKLSDKEMSDWGQKALEISPSKWKHGESAHFIIHFTRNGEKVARRSEEFYAEIKVFFGNRTDRLGEKKSQIFVFYKEEDWKKFREVTTMDWAAGVTRGNEFFYLSVSEEGRFDSKGRVQAHEMTHLIVNRFFEGRPPLWLNEGIAEYFGQRKTATVTDFRRQMGMAKRYGLDQLFKDSEYPKSKEAVQAFYAEAAIVVDFLSRTAERKALLPKFIEAMIGGADLEVALRLYGYKNMAAFTEAYEKYRKRF